MRATGVEKLVPERVRVEDSGVRKLLDVLRQDKGSGIYVLIWHRGKLVDFHRTGEGLVGAVS